MNGLRRTRALLAGTALLAAPAVASAEDTPTADPRSDRPDGGAAPEHERASFPVGAFTFRPFVEARVRGEYRRNPQNEGIFGEKAILSLEEMPTSRRDPYQDQALVWERVRLGLQVDWGPLTAVVSVQDVRMFGEPSAGGQLSGQPTLPVTAPSEGYLEIHTAHHDVWFRLGRQHVQIGDGRLIGKSDDRAPGRDLDAARLFGRIGPVDLQAMAAMLVPPGEPTLPDVNGDEPKIVPGAQLYVVDATWHVAPYFSAEATGIARLVRQPLVEHLTPSDTFVGALRLFGDHRGVRYSVLGAFEGGRVAPAGEVENATLIAGAVAGRVEWQTALPWSLTFGAQGAYATGDPAEGDAAEDGPPTKLGVFDPILPDTTKHFGQYDFYALSNLIEAGGDLSIKPVDELSARVSYRFAALANAKGPWVTGALFPIGQSETNESQMLGHVVGVDLEARPWEPLRIGASYGIMILGDGAKQIFLDGHPTLSPGDEHDFAETLIVDVRLDLP
jgi:hypothetical protein